MPDAMPDDTTDDTPAAKRDRARPAADGRQDGAPVRLLITAGPTHEPIDPVRSIANRSSGRLGVALARAAADRGWAVRLLAGPGVDTGPLTRCPPGPHAATRPLGPGTPARGRAGGSVAAPPANDQPSQDTQTPSPDPASHYRDHECDCHRNQERARDADSAARGADGPTDASPPSVERFQTAADLDRLLGVRMPWADALVMAAAVADYRPSEPSATKLSRSAGPLVLRLEPVADLLARACAGMRADQVAVGFALEDDPGDHARARAKMAAKGCHAIVLNPLATMEADAIDATILFADGRPPVAPGPMPKAAFATVLLDAVEGLLAGAVA